MQPTHSSIKELVSHITSPLLAIYDDKEQAQMIAWHILEFVTGYTKTQLLTNSQINSQQFIKRVKEILALHIIHKKPIQYIFESVPFLALNIKVKPGILIPRSETEYWCAQLIEDIQKRADHSFYRQPITVLDMCTGTGCIGLSLAQAFPNMHVYALDISPHACALTRMNQQQNSLANVTIIKSNVYAKLPRGLAFDLIVSNPPYISCRRWKRLDPMVKKWESATALTAKRAGTYLIKKIIRDAPQWLKRSSPLSSMDIPQLILEMDDDQSKKISKLLKRYGFGRIIVQKDLAGMDRVISASLKKIR